MILVLSRPLFRWIRIPRESGDDPDIPVGVPGADGYSPRERG